VPSVVNAVWNYRWRNCKGLWWWNTVNCVANRIWSDIVTTTNKSITFSWIPKPLATRYEIRVPYKKLYPATYYIGPWGQDELLNPRYTYPTYLAIFDAWNNTSYTLSGTACDTTYSWVTLRIYSWADYVDSLFPDITTASCSACPATFTDTRNSKTYNITEIAWKCFFSKSLEYGTWSYNCAIFNWGINFSAFGTEGGVSGCYSNYTNPTKGRYTYTPADIEAWVCPPWTRELTAQDIDLVSHTYSNGSKGGLFVYNDEPIAWKKINGTSFIYGFNRYQDYNTDFLTYYYLKWTYTWDATSAYPWRKYYQTVNLGLDLQTKWWPAIGEDFDLTNTDIPIYKLSTRCILDTP
jgi:hypothetical protein